MVVITFDGICISVYYPADDPIWSLSVKQRELITVSNIQAELLDKAEALKIDIAAGAE